MKARSRTFAFFRKINPQSLNLVERKGKGRERGNETTDKKRRDKKKKKEGKEKESRKEMKETKAFPASAAFLSVRKEERG